MIIRNIKIANNKWPARRAGTDEGPAGLWVEKARDIVDPGHPQVVDAAVVSVFVKVRDGDLPRVEEPWMARCNRRRIRGRCYWCWSHLLRYVRLLDDHQHPTESENLGHHPLVLLQVMASLLFLMLASLLGLVLYINTYDIIIHIKCNI